MGWEGEGAEGERKKLKTINRSFLNIKFYLFVYCIFRNENQKKCLKKKICRKIRNTIFASLSLPLYNLIKLLNEANFFHLCLWFSSTCRFKAFSVHFPIFTIHRGLNHVLHPLHRQRTQQSLCVYLYVLHDIYART